MSVLNAGYAPVPAAWRPRVDEFSKKLGYLDVAILTQDGSSAHVDLAIEGRRADRWYLVSKLTIRN